METWLLLTAYRTVTFDRGSAEPKDFASICQGFRGWPAKNNLACEITPDNVVKILRPRVLNHFCFVLSNLGIFAF